MQAGPVLTAACNNGSHCSIPTVQALIHRYVCLNFFRNCAAILFKLRFRVMLESWRNRNGRIILVSNFMGYRKFGMYRLIFQFSSRLQTNLMIFDCVYSKDLNHILLSHKISHLLYFILLFQFEYYLFLVILINQDANVNKYINKGGMKLKIAHVMTILWLHIEQVVAIRDEQQWTIRKLSSYAAPERYKNTTNKTINLIAFYNLS